MYHSTFAPDSKIPHLDSATVQRCRCTYYVFSYVKIYFQSIYHPPIKIIGLFFILTKFDMPACLAFFRLTASPISLRTSSSEVCGSLRWSRRFISVFPNRQTLRFPSAVSLKRLQVPQKLSLIEVMKPTRPQKPGTCQDFEVSFLASFSGHLLLERIF